MRCFLSFEKVRIGCGRFLSIVVVPYGSVKICYRFKAGQRDIERGLFSIEEVPIGGVRGLLSFEEVHA